MGSLPGGWELILIVLVILVLFGAKRLPEASRSLGRSMRIFKAETKGLRDDDDRSTTEATPVQTDVAPAAPVAPAVPVAPAAPVAQQVPLVQAAPVVQAAPAAATGPGAPPVAPAEQPHTTP